VGRPRLQGGAFIPAQLRAHDAANLEGVLADICREDRPDAADMTKFAAPDGRVWR
jgi:hypothetical protein